MILFPVHTHCINDTDHFDPSLSCGLTQIISTLNYFLIWTLHFFFTFLWTYRFTSCFISLILESRGQHFLLL